MKPFKKYTISLVVLACSVTAASQSADEIISEYIQAIGGAEVVKGIQSISIEASTKVVGLKVVGEITILNGKGFKTESRILGNTQVACYTDKSGWISSKDGKKVEDMPRDQYEAGKYQIFIGWPFLDYASQGYKAEFIGKERIGDVNAFKIGITFPDKTKNEYWFDTSTGYLIQSLQRAKMEGKEFEVILMYSDYYQTKGGYVMPLVTESKMGGKFSVTTRITKIAIDQPVPNSVFTKPN